MTKKAAPNMNYAWAGVMVREFVRQGVDRFFVAPGSRSSPLAIAAAEHGKRTTVHFDERGLGFAALGHARATGKPAVVITTSGTAVANLLPAVCEASQDEVPLIVLSADRPPELRGTCANQTMDQVNLFGRYARHFEDVPCPDAAIGPDYLVGLVASACTAASQRHPGPVHLNQMLREPLAPTDADDGAEKWLRGYTGAKAACEKSSVTSLCPETLISAADMLSRAKRGLIVLGDLSEADGQAAAEIAAKLKWPVLPDIRSGFRVGRASGRVIQFVDQVLLSRKFTSGAKADVILHLGGRITSKRIQQYIGECGARVIMVNGSPARMEQGAVPSIRLHADIGAFRMKLPDFRTSVSTSWVAKWNRADDAARAEWNTLLDRRDFLSEPAVAALISRHLPGDHALALAASMPVRDMEMYAVRRGTPVRVVANRGVSGIDGTVATAFGYALGAGRPVTLLIGDLALLHDLNSLTLIARARNPVTVVVVNNNGGGIFSMLPIAGESPHFEKYFGTPHGLSFEHAAELFGVPYTRSNNPEEFTKTFRAAARSGKSNLIEVVTDRAENAAEHRRIRNAIKRAVDHAVR